MDTKEDTEKDERMRMEGKVPGVEFFWEVLKEFIEASEIAVEEVQRAKERGEDIEEISGAWVWDVPGVPGGWFYNLTGPGAKYTYHVLGPAFLRKDLAAEFLEIIMKQGNGMLAGFLFRKEYIGPEVSSPAVENWLKRMNVALKTS